MKVSEYIEQELEKLDNVSGIVYGTFVGELLDKFPELKNRQYTASRINTVLRQKKFVNRFVKVKVNGEKYLRRNQLITEGGTNGTRSKGRETDEKEAVGNI